MKLVQLLAVGNVGRPVLERLRTGMASAFGVDCEIVSAVLDPRPSYHPERQQHHSSELLQRMQELPRSRNVHTLGITDVDLYIPILKYVFGEAQLGGSCALVSFCRLRQEFYGLESDDVLLGERVLKESMHELGHTLNLRHCQDYRCAMASAHAVEYIDLREAVFCQSCAKRAGLDRVLGGWLNRW
ncbi:MAG TPA: archaemetzincin [Candidatus Sulfotelmatobacter sp.]|nr:archaemetzincin [Candidatus Sulfotelmatobacter sp.]